MASQARDTREPGAVVTSLRLTEDEHAKLKRLAHSEHRSLSGQIRKLIEDAQEVEAA